MQRVVLQNMRVVGKPIDLSYPATCEERGRLDYGANA